MRYAIDRIRTGSEREVHANEFAAMPNIPFRLSRFFCPECGEQVFWRSGGGSHPCQFYHKTRTDTSPECDKRVDGRSELYQKRKSLKKFTGIVSNSALLVYAKYLAFADESLDDDITLDRYAAMQLLDWCSDSVLPQPLTYSKQDSLLLPLNSVGSDFSVEGDGNKHYMTAFVECCLLAILRVLIR